eukprot:RCo030487
MNGGCHLTAAASEVSEDTPPFSRLRVECPTSLSRDALQAEFEQYGTVEFVWPVLKHRVFTGVAFVKFDRASSAAFAAESLNSLGTFKVAFAMPRGQRPESFDDGESPPKSRLFLTFHKSATEEEVTQRLARFADLEHVKYLKSADTGEGRGIAFVKFAKTSSAFRAMEETEEQEQLSPTAPQPWRCKIADKGQSRSAATLAAA